MFVSERVRVKELARERHRPGRSDFVGRDGLLVQRLNTAWDPKIGALWRVRFDDGTEAVFAEAEVAVLDSSGQELPSEIPELQEIWGDAPRAGSMPYRRRLSSAPAQAVLAFLVLCVAGLLLVGAGVASGDLRIAAGGGALVVVGIGAAAALVT